MHCFTKFCNGRYQAWNMDTWKENVANFAVPFLYKVLPFDQIKYTLTGKIYFVQVTGHGNWNHMTGYLQLLSLALS